MAQSKIIMPLAVIVIVAVAIVGTYYYAAGPAAGVTAISVDTIPVKGGVTVDGVSWGTAPVSREVDPGTYTVTFGAVTDYTTPASQSVTVASGETKSITVPYVSVEPEKLKVAFALPGYLSDASWNAAMYVTAHELADEMDLDIAISEGLGWEGVESTLIYYASEGYDIIICHSSGQQDIALRIAPDYPDTMFFGASFSEFAPNVVGFSIANNEAGYLTGILAGGVSKTGIIGYIHGAEFPDIRVNLNAYIMGAQLMNPDIKVLRAFTGDYEDLTKGMETALAMLDAGADVINPGGDGLTLGAIQAIHSRNTKEDPRYAIGYVTDQNSIAPDTVLSTQEFYFTVMLRDLITKYREGTLEGDREYIYGLKEGGIGLGPFHGLEDVVPQETKDAINQAIEDFIAGTLEVPFIMDYVIET